MNTSEMRWLLQTIDEPETAQRFVMAQYKRGRISYRVMADIAEERGWINWRANKFFVIAAKYLTEYVTPKLPVVNS
jgi:hypothetical protein